MTQSPPEPTSLDQQPDSKDCSRCGTNNPISHYLRRTGRHSGKASRRGTCRNCRKQIKLEHQQTIAPDMLVQVPDVPNIEQTESTAIHTTIQPNIASPSAMIATARPVRSLPSIKETDIRGKGLDLAQLHPTRKGIIHMRGRTDKGLRWRQETNLETARILVQEHAAVVVNQHTIRRLYSNKAFRQYILTRDEYTCYFCGGAGDTIDHLLARAKGGHTTPLNCVCACMLCNQVKADRDLTDFVEPLL